MKLLSGFVVKIMPESGDKITRAEPLEFEFNTQTPGIMRWINERGAEFVTSSTTEQKKAIASKFTDYALNPEKDKNKALAFEKALGYNKDNVDDLIGQIRYNLPFYNSVEKGDKGYGMTYEVVMDITGPNGKQAKVLTGWIKDSENGEVRLITAHVDKEK